MHSIALSLLGRVQRVDFEYISVRSQPQAVAAARPGGSPSRYYVRTFQSPVAASRSRRESRERTSPRRPQLRRLSRSSSRRCTRRRRGCVPVGVGAVDAALSRHEPAMAFATSRASASLSAPLTSTVDELARASPSRAISFARYIVTSSIAASKVLASALPSLTASCPRPFAAQSRCR